MCEHAGLFSLLESTGDVDEGRRGESLEVFDECVYVLVERIVALVIGRFQECDVWKKLVYIGYFGELYCTGI